METRDVPDAAYMSVSKIAERDGVTKGAISKQVAKYADTGLDVRRDIGGRIVAVNVVHFDELRGQYGNAIRRQAPDRPTTPEAPKESLEEAQRLKAWQDVERGRLRANEETGKLMRVDRVIAATEQIAVEIGIVLDRLPTFADEISLAVSQEGAHGARTALKKLAHRLRETISGKFHAMMSEAPATDSIDDLMSD